MQDIVTWRRFAWWWVFFLSAASVGLAQQLAELSRLPALEETAAAAPSSLPEVDDPTSLPEVEDPSNLPAVDEEEVDEAEAEDDEADAVDESVDAVITEPWYTPDVIFNRQIWESSLEFGINGTTGNAESMSFRVGADSKHKTDCNTLAVSFSYARTQADGRETQNNSLLTVRDDWDFSDSPWAMFARQTTEYDEFKAFDVRVSANGGLGYFLVNDGTSKFKGRFGGGFSREIGGPNDDLVPEAVFGADIETKLTERQKVEGTIDYLPEWADWNDYRVESKFSWSVRLDSVANLSLKLSVIERYDSTPEGRKPNDLDYALLLLWKL